MAFTIHRSPHSLRPFVVGGTRHFENSANDPNGQRLGCAKVNRKLNRFHWQRRLSLFKMSRSILKRLFSSRNRSSSVSTNGLASTLACSVPSASKNLRRLWIKVSPNAPIASHPTVGHLLLHNLLDSGQLVISTKTLSTNHQSFSIAPIMA